MMKAFSLPRATIFLPSNFQKYIDATRFPRVLRYLYHLHKENRSTGGDLAVDF